MVFKLLILSVACIFIINPVHCGIISKLSSIKNAATGAASDIATIVPNMFKAKGAAIVQAAAQTGNIIAVGAGLKVQALEKASSSIKDAISGGLVSIGRLLSRQGTGLVENKLDSSPCANIGQVPYNNVPAGVDTIIKFGRRHFGVGLPYRYRMVYTPRVYRGPCGTIQIE